MSTRNSPVSLGMQKEGAQGRYSERSRGIGRDRMLGALLNVESP